MKIREMRELSPEDLQSQIKETRAELVELRFQHAGRKLDNTAKLKLTRRKLAQLLTVAHAESSAS